MLFALLFIGAFAFFAGLWKLLDVIFDNDSNRRLDQDDSTIQQNNLKEKQ